LNLGGTGIRIVQFVSGNNGILSILLQHCYTHLSFRFVRPEPRRRPVIGAHPSSVILTAKLLYNTFFKK
jgi:hypothetical protein